MPLSAYHQKYAGKSDEEIEKRAEVKEQELASIFRKVSFFVHFKLCFNKYYLRHLIKA